MIKLLDQFETLSTTDYSSSYGSRVFLNNSSIFKSTSQYLQRNVVGDSSTSKFYSASMLNRIYLYSDYPQILAAVKTIKQGFNRFWVGQCNDEQFADTVIGHPIYYSVVNGISSSVGVPNQFAYDETEVQDLGVPFIAPTSSIMLFVGTSSCTVGMADGAAEKFCDNIWNYTGPFQSRYRNVFRLKSPSFKIPFAGKTVISQALFSGNSFRRNTLNFTASYTSISMLMFVTKSGPSNELPDQMSVMLDRPLVASGPPLNLVTLIPIAANSAEPTMTTNILYNSYFGFGDGPHSFPVGSFQANYVLNGVQYYFHYNPIIRGWKYGLYDAKPRFSRAIYRYGKFGQPRDLLEQRQNSKFYLNGTFFDSAVKVTFTTSSLAYSRSLDYVTATNPSYDPRDTGFFDRDYRCGHPFVDIEPTD